MRTISALGAALLVMAAVAHADTKTYSLADLERLVADTAYQEAFMHLGDVPPAQRTAAWIDIAATASAGVLQALPTDDGSLLGAIDLIDREYPQLKKSAKYVKARAELGVQGIAGCFETSRDCLRVVMRFVDNVNDRKVTLEAAKKTIRGLSAAEAVPLFKRALDPADAKPVCRDEHARRAVVAGLGRPADTAIAGDARALMTTCFADMKDEVVKAFGEAGKGSAIHENTCDFLKAKRLLSPLQIKRCK